MASNCHRRTDQSASNAWSTINMVMLELFLEEFDMLLDLHASFQQAWTLAPTGTPDKHFNDFNFNIGGVVHNMASNCHRRTDQSASNAWSTINMVMLELFLEEFDMLLDLHASFQQAWTLAPTGTPDKHFNDFNFNIGGVVHNMASNCHRRTDQSASNAWSTINMVMLELFLEEFDMLV
ncbi:hypothetical protein DFH27DRAFT_616963 [Peziza echinospora]|nr:hypothetical protein DFH27DRAFT_616963 [Peziza echinospora]